MGEISEGRRSVALAVTRPSQGLSLGKAALSRRSTDIPFSAHSRAVVLPAGPAPATMTSYILVRLHLLVPCRCTVTCPRARWPHSPAVHLAVQRAR